MYLCPALAVQRYIFVCHPSLAKTWCTVRKSSMLVMMTVLMAVITTSTRMMDRTYFVASDSGEALRWKFNKFQGMIGTLELE